MQALILIASLEKNEYVLAKQISAVLSIPRDYLNKVMQILVKEKFVKSLKGPQGGFCLAREPQDITIYDIMKAIDGTDFFNNCLLRAALCDAEDPCALHDYWQKVLGQIRSILDRVTLHDLVQELKEGREVLQFADNIFLIKSLKDQIGIG
jgi:Rrf2 family transcriptional regulator, iron-sulfur cluster assembly transcription factor